jgi:hypothetical protein
MTAGDIRALVLTSEKGIVEMLDEKLNGFKEGVDSSLQTFKEGVDGRLDTQDRQLEEVHDLVKKIDLKGDLWHGEDGTYRESVKTSLADLKRVADSVRFWSYIFYGLRYVRVHAKQAAKESREMSHAITAFAAAAVAVMNVVHFLWPGHVYAYLFRLFHPH